MYDAVTAAKELVFEAIKGSLRIGRGHGPVNVLVNLHDAGRDK